ncbi:DUF1294 domain-containing protein [Pseudalkalibacillus hwajinpoensis]|uniref:DUF1294 domain-containing protein n=1 Tax=Guptibacillus hwajinpoensis TaxID=208199 RepID=UPI00325B3CB7
MSIYYLFFVYIALLNIWSYAAMGWDKRRARKRGNRIAERNLWTLFIIGGSIGGYAGMKHFRHKTKHRQFVIGIPVLVTIQLVLFAGGFYILNRS